VLEDDFLLVLGLFVTASLIENLYPNDEASLLVFSGSISAILAD
jgi:hypothetical protein